MTNTTNKKKNTSKKKSTNKNASKNSISKNTTIKKNSSKKNSSKYSNLYKTSSSDNNKSEVKKNPKTEGISIENLKEECRLIYKFLMENKTKTIVCALTLLFIILLCINNDSKSKANNAVPKSTNSQATANNKKDSKKTDKSPDLEDEDEIETGESNFNKLSSLIKSQKYDDSTIEKYKKDNIVDTSKQVYSYEEMIEDTEILYNMYPDIVNVHDLCDTFDGRKVFEITIGNLDAEKHILIHASIHAREYITTLLVMKQAEYYLKNYDEGSYKGVDYDKMFDKVCLHIIPMVNPDGVTISQFGTEKINNQETKDKLYEYFQRDLKKGFVACDYDEYLSIWKSNSIGTDINKNFDQGWESYEGPVIPSRLNYKGSAPESEPETRALVNTVNQYNIVATIAYHATGSVIYWDYGQTGDFRTECYNFVKAVKEINNYSTPNSKEKKLSPAGYSNWCVLIKGIPAITCEVGTGKAPVPQAEFNTIWKDNRLVVANICRLYYE